MKNMQLKLKYQKILYASYYIRHCALFYSVAVLPGDFLALQTSAELSVVNTGVIRRSSPPFFFDDPTPLAEEKC
jgi:hypothetical protein